MLPHWSSVIFSRSRGIVRHKAPAHVGRRLISRCLAERTVHRRHVGAYQLDSSRHALRKRGVNTAVRKQSPAEDHTAHGVGIVTSQNTVGGTHKPRKMLRIARDYPAAYRVSPGCRSEHKRRQ